ncbi:MAG: T9SS type A sorting domain-containing protein [Bacteroidetes bacterium]|nr:T9SS type A sorting domain-containing protein [Bacteroidota bacterium]
MAISGYNDGEKVFYSNNAGSSWTNISGTLPNVPVNTIVYENVSETDRVYIGTDIGVFTKDNVAGDWEPYMTGLPNVMVHELVINYSDSKLYAATYGRSVWKSDLYNYAAPSLTVSVPGTTFCLNQSVDIAYTAVGSFTAGNVFAIELSDETGAFADPVTIGSVTSTALTGNITCIIPAATVLGSDYRMRATSTQQEYIGLKNGSDLSIVCSKPINVETATINPTSVTLTWDASLCGVAYEVEYKQVAAATWTVVTTPINSIIITDLVPNTAYEWAVRTICVESPLVQSTYTSIEDFVTGQNNVQIIPGLSHIAIFPNPVSTTASVEIVLTQTTDLSIELLDILGQSISVLVDDKLNAGSHTFELNRNQLTSGVYTLQITSGKNVVAKNIVIE